MKSQGLGQGRHGRGPGIIQNIDLQGMIGDPPDGLESGLDDFQRFAAARHEDVHGERGWTPGVPAGDSGDATYCNLRDRGEGGQDFGREEKDIRRSPAGKHQPAQPDQIGQSQNQGHQGENPGLAAMAGAAGLLTGSTTARRGEAAPQSKRGFSRIRESPLTRAGLWP